MTFLIYCAYAILYVLVYYVVFVVFTGFFERPRVPAVACARPTVGATLGGLALVFLIVHLIAKGGLSDLFGSYAREVSNRVLHIFGGGFLAYFMCWRIVRDAKLRLTRWQTLVICFMTVSTLGVANELVESILQLTTGVIMSPTPLDTWFDLWGNTIGAAIAAVVTGAVAPGFTRRADRR